MKRPVTVWIVAFIALCSIQCTTAPIDKEIITIKKNGGWCWFQDERVIVRDNIVFFGSVATGSGYNGEAAAGNIEVTAYDLGQRENLGTGILHENLDADDHNVPALLFLDEGRLLAVYSKHGGDKKIRYRISVNPLDHKNWEAEKINQRDARVTYSNLHYLQNENNGNGRIYNFYRGEHYNPNFIISDDQGGSWRYGGHLIKFSGRPYVKYVSDGRSKIHFVTTEGHPRDVDNSIYHAFMENGFLHTSDGRSIKNLAGGAMRPAEGTTVFAGDSMNVAWTIDIHLDDRGYPYTVYSVQKNKDSTDIRYRYARWDGNKWHDHFLAHAGTAFYPREADYSGLVALDPHDPDVLYISTDADPVSGAALVSAADQKRHYEIFKGVTKDNGLNWSWTALTIDSERDNIRPIMPIRDGENTVLLWLRGMLKTYRDFDLNVVGIIDP